MIPYSIKQRVNPQAPLDPRKYYAFIKIQGAVDLRQLAKRISRESTISMMDTMAVLEGLLQVVPDLLTEGKIVRLGEFGNFSVNIKSVGAENLDDFNATYIKGLKLNFRPGALFRNRLTNVKFSKLPEN